jgi:dihydroorotase
VDLKGLVVCPGFVDMHVHLREPGGEESETIRSGTLAAAAGGFTAVAAMPNTTPVNDNPSVTEAILREASHSGAVPVYPVAAITRGSHGKELTEFGLLREAGAVAISDDGHCVGSPEVMRRALEYASMHELLLIDHAEDGQLAPGGVMNEGPVSTRLGLRGIPAAREDLAVARDIILTRLTGARLHLAHVSTAGSVAMVRQAREEGLRVSAEVTPHHLALTDEAVEGYDPDTKMNPPLRSESDRQALLKGLRDGTLEVIATDHAPHHPDLKAVEFDAAPYGVIGLETAVPVVLDILLHTEGVELSRIVELMSVNPNRVLGLPGGSLAVDAPADLTVLELERELTIDPDRFHSLSRNTPFKGQSYRGAPVMTIVAGKLVWQAETSSGRGRRSGSRSRR